MTRESTAVSLIAAGMPEEHREPGSIRTRMYSGVYPSQQPFTCSSGRMTDSRPIQDRKYPDATSLPMAISFRARSSLTAADS